MPVGYPIANNTRIGEAYGYAGQQGEAFVRPVGAPGRWIVPGYDGADHRMFEKPAAPANPGDPSTWPIVQSSAGGDSLLDTRGAGFPMLCPVDDQVHVFVNHSSARRYKFGVIEAAGTVLWLVGGEGNGESVTVGGNQSRNQCCVDFSGRPWWMWTTATQAVAKVRDAGVWQADVVIDTYPSYSDYFGNIFRYIHLGVPGLGVVYNRGLNTLSFRYRLDSDPLGDPWRFGWDHPVTMNLDNHTIAQSVLVDGDTSTIFGSVKRSSGGNTVDAFRAAPLQAPDPNMPQISAAMTRQSVIIDATNAVGRIAAQSAGLNPLIGCDFDLTQPLPAIAPATFVIVDDDGATSNANGSDAPSHEVTSETGWLHRSDQGSDYWWNEEPISGGEPTLAIDGASHAHAAATVDLAYDALVVPEASTHAHTAEQVALDVQIALDELRHAHTAEIVDLVQASTLVVQGASHAHTAETVTLAEGAILELAELLHAHTAESVTFVPADVLMLDELQHRHTAEIVGLVQAGSLVVQDARHAHTAESVVLVLDLVLDVDQARHKHVADNVALDTSTLLELAELRHAHRAANVDLVQASALQIEGARHAHRAANVVIIDDQGKPVIDPSARVYVAADATRVYIARDPVPRIS